MWFEWLFKYPRHVFAQGEWAFTGDLGTWWWILAAALLAVSIVFARRLARWRLSRRVPLHVLQAAAVAVILVLLAGPALEVQRLAPGVNTVAVLVDTSKSMVLPARAAAGIAAGQPDSRIAIAKRLVEEWIAPGVGAPVALFQFGDELQRVTATDVLVAAGDRSRLVDALTNLAANYDQGALAAVVALTDGARNGGDGTDLDALGAAGVPIHLVGIGPSAIAGDVELAELTMPRSAPPNTQVTARLVIRAAAREGADVRVRVRDGPSVIAVETIRVGRATPVLAEDIAFPSGAAGLKEITVELEAPAHDPLPGNNTRTRLLDVATAEYHVLYLEGEPRWEFKFIRRAVAEDDEINLATWLRTTPRKTYRQGVADADDLAGGFPDSLEALYGYHLVILGSLPATVLDDEQHEWLESFVAERGGSVLVLAGRNALTDGGWDVKPLARALPVVLQRSADDAPTYAAGDYGAQPTEAGLASALIDIGGDSLDERERSWATLPMLADYQRLGELKAAATTYLQVQGSVRVVGGEQPAVVVRGGSAQPLLVAQPYGFGQTAVLATASTWRWRMRTPPDDVRHSLFWRQLIRHLAGAALPRQRLSVVASDDELAVRVALRNARFEPTGEAAVTARITAPNGESFDTSLPRLAGENAFGKTLAPGTPGIYRVQVSASAAGELRAQDNDFETLARVGAENLEDFAAALNEPLLRRIAEATGGRVWNPDDLAGLADAIAYGGAGVQELERLPLWDAPFLYLLLVLLKCAEWSLRRYWGGI